MLQYIMQASNRAGEQAAVSAEQEKIEKKKCPKSISSTLDPDPCLRALQRQKDNTEPAMQVKAPYITAAFTLSGMRM